MPRISAAQSAPSKEFLPPLPAGKEWKLIWNDEFDGTKLNDTKSNLHWDGYERDHKTAGANRTNMPELTEGFHNYALLWTPDECVFYEDGKEVWRTKAGGVSQVPEYILVTKKIGTWGGDIKKAELPDFCELDYVRAYEMSN